jgi:hypothetical protein
VPSERLYRTAVKLVQLAVDSTLVIHWSRFLSARPTPAVSLCLRLARRRPWSLIMFSSFCLGLEEAVTGTRDWACSECVVAI